MAKRLVGLACAAWLTCVSGVADAGLIDGDDLRIERLVTDTPFALPSWDVVVGTGVEVPDAPPFSTLVIDVSSGSPSILFDFGDLREAVFGRATFNGFRFSDYTGTLSTFTGVSINGITNMVGFDASRVTVTADSIDVNFESLSWDGDGTFVALDLASASVPEPTTSILLGLGLLAVALRRRT